MNSETLALVGDKVIPLILVIVGGAFYRFIPAHTEVGWAVIAAGLMAYQRSASKGAQLPQS